MSRKNIKGITIEIDGSTTGLDKALEGVNKKSRDIQSELKEVDRLLKFNPGNTELVTQKQKLLGDAVENTKEKLEKLKSAQAEVTRQFEAGEIGEEQYRAVQREIVETESKLTNLEKKLKDTNNKWKDAAKAFDDFGNKADAAGRKVAPLSKAAGGALAGMAGLAVKAGQTADDLNTLSKTTGLSTDTIQKMKYASDLLDVSFDTVEGSLTKLTKNMSSAQDGTGKTAEIFKELGVSVTDASGNLRNNEAVFYDTIDALGKVANETERDAKAMEIFGKSAQDLNPLIIGGADALRDMGAAAEERGLIIPQEELDKANEFNDILDTIKAEGAQSLMSLGIEIGQALLPVLEKLSDVISTVLEWMRGLDEGTLSTIMMVLGLVAGLAPLLIIVGKVATGIGALMGLMPVLGAGFAFLASPIGIVIAVMAALVLAGVWLWKNWDKIKEFAANLGTSLKTTFTNIKTAIVTAFSGVITGIKTIWTNIVSFMKGLPAQMLGFGKDMIQGLINGITGMVGKVGEAVANVGKKIVGGVKGFFGINSPSKLMMGLGEFTGEGFALGIENMAKTAGEAAQQLSGAVVNSTTTQTVNGGVDVGGTLNINITGEGAGRLNSDPRFIDQVKTAILSEITLGNRSIPNRTSLIPIG